jgi:hypothetical protein
VVSHSFRRRADSRGVGSCDVRKDADDFSEDADANYGGVWLLGKKGDAAPSAGHAIDHIGFRPLNVDDAVASFKTKNVKVTAEPRPLVLPSGTAMRLAFIEGPDGIRIELVQRDNLK